VLPRQVRIVKVQRWHGLRARAARQHVVEIGRTLLVGELEAEQHPVLDAAGMEQALGFQVVVDAARAQVLLPTGTRDLAGGGAVAGQVGVIELAVQREHAQRVAQLPARRQRVGQARAE